MPNDRRPIDEENTSEFDIASLRIAGIDRSQSRVKMPALTAIQGRALGRVFRLGPGEMIIGRADDSAICIQDDGVSRRHAKIETKDGRHVLTDLGSRNGTIVNDEIATGPVVLSDGDSIRMGPNTVLRYAPRDEIDDQLQARLYDLATRDPLTQANNRRAFDEHLTAEWAWAKRHDKPVALCSFDADHFKRVNDTCGHAGGDYVLSELANVVRGVVRREDMFARVGGEEFVVLARDTARGPALILAERLRGEVERHSFVFGETRIPVTISVGVATSRDDGVTSQTELVQRADAALYRAKHEGRNRVGS